MLISHPRLMQLITAVLVSSIPMTGMARKLESDEQKKELDSVERTSPRLPQTKERDKAERTVPRTPATKDSRTDRTRYPEKDTRTTIKRETRRPLPPTPHDRVYYKDRKDRKKLDYRNYQTYRYNTYYMAPIRRVYRPIGTRYRVLPVGYISIIVSGFPYFYFDGIFYQSFDGGYVVVHAPIGARVHVLPVGFIIFTIGLARYYYVNDVYYVWDEDLEAYVVVKKPAGADAAIAKATEGRLFVYPKQGQSEEQQAKDRYACHKWAVKESGVDPIEDEAKVTSAERREYKRAISACLEGRGYTVK